MEFGDAVAETQLGGNYNGSISAKGTPLMKMGNMARGRFVVDQFERLRKDADVTERDLLEVGDLILNTRNSLDLVGKVAMWRGELRRAVFNSNMMRLVPDGETIESTAFLNQLLNSEPKLRQIRRRATGTTSVAAIYWRDLQSLVLLFPPKKEQRKIADILGTWDEALEKLDALIAVKERRKKGLIQQLLFGRCRLSGFDRSSGKRLNDRFASYPSDWQRLRLGSVTAESSTRAESVSGAVVLSSTKHHGLVPSEEYFGRRVYAADVSNYKVVRCGEFAYATNHIEEGSIGHQTKFKIGLVSPIYTVFRTNGRTDDRYLYRLLKSHLLVHLYQVNTSASVNRRGSLRYKEFERIQVWLPSKSEQTAIADILDTTDAELVVLRKKREAINLQKRGLMQRLLTGRIRVVV